MKEENFEKSRKGLEAIVVAHKKQVELARTSLLEFARALEPVLRKAVRDINSAARNMKLPAEFKTK
jgi:hypothetical protein